MSVVIDGTLGITSPAETVQGALTTTGNTLLGDASTDTLNVGNGGLVKDASGNVGIGTSNSAAGKLSVAGRIGAFNTTGANDSLVQIWNSGTSSSISSTYSSTGAYTPIDFLTSDTVRASITAAGLFQFNSGYGSAATAYGCRAWVNFNGQAVAIRASGNVSSITDNGTGDYTVNFTTAIVDINYSISAYCAYLSTSVAAEYSLVGDCIKLVGSLRIVTGYVSSLVANLTLADRLVNDIAIFR